MRLFFLIAAIFVTPAFGQETPHEKDVDKHIKRLLQIRDHFTNVAMLIDGRWSHTAYKGPLTHEMQDIGEAREANGEAHSWFLIANTANGNYRAQLIVDDGHLGVTEMVSDGVASRAREYAIDKDGNRRMQTKRRNPFNKDEWEKPPAWIDQPADQTPDEFRERLAGDRGIMVPQFSMIESLINWTLFHESGLTIEQRHSNPIEHTEVDSEGRLRAKLHGATWVFDPKVDNLLVAYCVPPWVHDDPAFPHVSGRYIQWAQHEQLGWLPKTLTTSDCDGEFSRSDGRFEFKYRKLDQLPEGDDKLAAWIAKQLNAGDLIKWLEK